MFWFRRHVLEQLSGIHSVIGRLRGEHDRAIESGDQDIADLDERLSALERCVAEGDRDDATGEQEAAVWSLSIDERVASLEAQVKALDDHNVNVYREYVRTCEPPREPA